MSRRKVLLAGGTLLLAVVTACSGAASPTATPRQAAPSPTATVAPSPGATATPVPTQATPTPTLGATPVPTQTTAAPSPTATTVPDQATAAPGSGGRFVWDVQEVDRGVKAAIALDSSGTPYVMYMLEALSGYTRVATMNGSTWDIVTLATGYFYGPGDIVIGPDDVVHVTFHNHQAPTFRLELGDATYAVFRDGEWSVSDAFDPGHDGWDNRITVDAEGRPHMSAIDPEGFDGNGVEYYRLRADGSWEVEEIGSGRLDYKFATSIAVDPQGTPHITYYDQDDNVLKLGSRGPSGWSIATVDDDGETGLFSYMVIDRDGRFHISYLERTSSSAGVVKYATREASDSSWQISEVGRLSGLRFGMTGARNITSLALDSQGNPWIAYSDQEVVKLAIQDGSAWRTETVVEAGSRPLGQMVSLKIDAQDEPHISFFEVTRSGPLEGLVKYAKGSGAG